MVSSLAEPCLNQIHIEGSPGPDAQQSIFKRNMSRIESSSGIPWNCEKTASFRLYTTKKPITA